MGYKFKDDKSFDIYCLDIRNLERLLKRKR